MKFISLAELKGQIFSFLEKNDVVYSDDYNKVITISEEPDLTKKMFELALDELVESKILVRADHGDKKCWVLVKPIISYSQDVSLSVSTILYIKAIFAKISEFSDEQMDFDPFNIKEKDIQKICLLLGNILSEKED